MSTQVIRAFIKPAKSLSPEDEGFRAFPITAEDKHGLELPGCLAIEEIRMGRHTMPAEVEHQVPVDNSDKKFETKIVPLYTLDDGANGVPILLRSLSSNDGHWQEGETLYIKGAWAPEKKAITPPPVVSQPAVPASNPKRETKKKAMTTPPVDGAGGDGKGTVPPDDSQHTQ